MLGASSNEIALVGLLVLVVLLAPKVPRIGEALGDLFDRGARRAPPPRGEGERASPPGRRD